MSFLVLFINYFSDGIIPNRKDDNSRIFLNKYKNMIKIIWILTNWILSISYKTADKLCLISAAMILDYGKKVNGT